MQKQLLDPLGTMCKIIALNFMDINTKISIQNHILILQEPNHLQFLVRYYHGDGKNNVSELYYVVIRIITWFLVPINNTDERKDSNLNLYSISSSKEIKNLVKYLINAFIKLQETYKDCKDAGSVILTLQFFINILSDGLAGVYDNNKLPRYLVDGEKEYDTLLDYDKIKNLWSYDKLKQITTLYDACFNIENDEENIGIKHTMINGYLKSIDAILTTKDHEFQSLVKYGNKR